MTNGLSRRTFIAGAAALIAAPAVIRIPGILMPVKQRLWVPPTTGLDWHKIDDAEFLTFAFRAPLPARRMASMLGHRPGPGGLSHDEAEELPRAP